MTYEQYSAEWLAKHCDDDIAFERAVKRHLSRLLAENVDYRNTCEHLLRQTHEQIGEIVALKDQLSLALIANAEASAYKQAYFQLAEKVVAGQALTAPTPVQVEMPEEFFEWRAMHPSLTNLQAFLAWKEKKV